MSSETLSVKVTLYASLREAVGVESISLMLPVGSKVKALQEILGERHPIFKKWGDSLAWAVNHEYASLSDPLNDGDEVAALPPISGGCGATKADFDG